MSRIGKLPIAVPAAVKVTLAGTKVTVEGPKGQLEQTFEDIVTIEQGDAQIRVHPKGNSRHARAMHGTVRAIIAGMVLGVQQVFSKELECICVGFRASVEGRILHLSLGHSYTIHHEIPDGITVTTPEATRIRVEGPSKFLVGRVAADIKRYRPAEPYQDKNKKNRGVRILGEFVRVKEGKKIA